MKLAGLWVLFVGVTLSGCDKPAADSEVTRQTAQQGPTVFGRVDGTQAKDLVTKGAKLLDVRTPGEFASGHIDGAVNIPVQDLQTRLGELDKVQPVVVYCASGKRSSAAMSMMKEGGFAQVYDLGGKSNW